MHHDNGDEQTSSEFRLASPLKRLSIFSRKEDHEGKTDMSVLLSPKREKELMKDRKFFSPAKSILYALRQSLMLGQVRKGPRKEEADDEHDKDKEDNDEENPLTEEEVMILLCRELELIGDDEQE